ncbi:MAG: MogA/MoaB family molybdenum cofactor biosynthesis protein [Desulfatibacillaceae bacterium]|nr:MogA/MoaB family molybdenum cofactor biosynthesis protein [Desulfatibacillaceae bacterium]
MSLSAHRHAAVKSARVAIITVTSTRILDNDESGKWIAKAVTGHGHKVVEHRIAPDDQTAISLIIQAVLKEHSPDVMLINGGTGITPSDVTIEAVEPLFDKKLPAFSCLFAQLSFEKIDAAAVFSRACAGTIENTLVFCMPGSKNACKLAVGELILPDLGHAVAHARG